MGLADIKTTEWMLIQWGRWAHVNKGVSVNYPSAEPYERMRAKREDEKTPPLPQITDDEAVVIDMAVAQLCQARPKEGDALALYYLYSPTYRELGKRLGKHHSIVAQWVDSGKMWVEGRIIGLL